MKRFTFILILLVNLSMFIISTEAEAFVKDPVYDDLEGFDLVASLIRDGKLDLAAEELKQKSLQKQDPDRYQLYMGKLNFARSKWVKAQGHFRKAQKSKDPTVMSDAQLQGARTDYQLKEYSECRDLYGKKTIEPLLAENDYIQKSFCEFKSKSPEKSWATLLAAKEKFASFAIERELISLKINLKLNHEALLNSLDWLHGKTLMSSQFLNLAEIFHTQGFADDALMILEAGRARDPMNSEINLTLSQIYFQKNNLSASAEGFARAAETDSKYFYHAAELNRQLGNTKQSAYYNIFIAEPKEKLKQKIASFVDIGNFPMIASLESIIQRSELAKDDEIRYALAYSLVREGQIDQPLKYLSQITKPELLEKTTMLRKTLLDCQSNTSGCHL